MCNFIKKYHFITRAEDYWYLVTVIQFIHIIIPHDGIVLVSIYQFLFLDNKTKQNNIAKCSIKYTSIPLKPYCKGFCWGISNIYHGVRYCSNAMLHTHACTFYCTRVCV